MSTNVNLNLNWTGVPTPKPVSADKRVRAVAEVAQKTLDYEPLSDLLKTFGAWVSVLKLGRAWQVLADMADFPLMNIVKAVGALSKWVIKTTHLAKNKALMGDSVPAYGKQTLDRCANWTLYTAKMVAKVGKAIFCCAKFIFNVPGIRLCGLAIVTGVVDMAAYTLSCTLGTKDIVIDAKRCMKKMPTCERDDFTTSNNLSEIQNSIKVKILEKYGNTKSEYFNKQLDEAIKDIAVVDSKGASDVVADDMAAAANQVIKKLHPLFKAHQKKAILAHVAILTMDLALLAITVIGFAAAITGVVPVLAFALLGLIPCAIGAARHGLVKHFKSSAS